jgi:hypothetical protein
LISSFSLESQIGEKKLGRGLSIIVLAAEHHIDALIDSSLLPTHQLSEIHHNKISLHRAKAGYHCPTIRLPRTFSKLAGLPTRSYQTVHLERSLLVMTSPNETTSKTPKASVFTQRRSGVRISMGPSFFLQSATLEPSSTCEKAMSYQFNVNQIDK